MTLGIMVSEAVRSIIAKKQRSILALIGIIIGIGSVISMISVGNIVKNEAVKQFKDLGTNVLHIRKDIRYDQNGQPIKGENFSMKHVYRLRSSVNSLQRLSPYTDIFMDIEVSGMRTSFSLMGVTQDFLEVNKVYLKSGRFIRPADSNALNCVVGNSVYEKVLSAGDDPRLIINSTEYNIVGVLERDKAIGGRPFDLDRSVMISLDSALEMKKDAEISEITAIVNPDVPNQIAKQAVLKFFDSYKGLSVMVDSPDELIKQMNKQVRMFTLLLGAIGSISLVVGGIGIMNVMLVSVSERKKEIGIRRALGARRSHIQLQFLTECVLLTFVGGITGVLTGVGISFAISKFSGWEFLISNSAIIAGLVMSFGIGGFFGYYPARQASRLDPIQALRSD